MLKSESENTNNVLPHVWFEGQLPRLNLSTQHPKLNLSEVLTILLPTEEHNIEQNS